MHNVIFDRIIQVSMVVFPVSPYFSQYLKLKRTKEGFSQHVCGVLIIANIFKIFFWYCKRFDITMLFQGIAMFLVQFWLLAASNATIRIKRRYPYTDVDIKGIYVYIFLILQQLIALVILQFKWGDNSLYIEALGFVGVSFEAGVPIPQVIKNFINQSVEGFSPLVLAVWFIGDICKIAYHFYFRNPKQFVICGIVQVSLDCMLLYQFIKYRDPVYKFRKEEQQRLLNEEYKRNYYPSNLFEGKASHQRYLTEGTVHENAYDEAVMDPKPQPQLQQKPKPESHIKTNPNYKIDIYEPYQYQPSNVQTTNDNNNNYNNNSSSCLLDDDDDEYINSSISSSNIITPLHLNSNPEPHFSFSSILSSIPKNTIHRKSSRYSLLVSEMSDMENGNSLESNKNFNDNYCSSIAGQTKPPTLNSLLYTNNTNNNLNNTTNPSIIANINININTTTTTIQNTINKNTTLYTNTNNDVSTLFNNTNTSHLYNLNENNTIENNNIFTKNSSYTTTPTMNSSILNNDKEKLKRKSLNILFDNYQTKSTLKYKLKYGSGRDEVNHSNKNIFDGDFITTSTPTTLENNKKPERISDSREPKEEDTSSTTIEAKKLRLKESSVNKPQTQQNKSNIVTSNKESYHKSLVKSNKNNITNIQGNDDDTTYSSQKENMNPNILNNKISKKTSFSKSNVSFRQDKSTSFHYYNEKMMAEETNPLNITNGIMTKSP